MCARRTETGTGRWDGLSRVGDWPVNAWWVPVVVGVLFALAVMSR